MRAPLKPQTSETGFQSAIFWKHNLLSGCVHWQNIKPMKAMTTLMLMLMLAQVNAFPNDHYQTLMKQSTVHPKQVPKMHFLSYLKSHLKCVRHQTSFHNRHTDHISNLRSEHETLLLLFQQI